MRDPLADLRSELDALCGRTDRHEEFHKNIQAGGNLRFENGKLTFDKPLQKSVTGTARIPGPMGAAAPDGPTGPTGQPVNGGGGIPGPTGVTGPTGPKDCIIRSHLGNVAFSPIEGERPYLFIVYAGTGSRRIQIEPRFLASVLPGSLMVIAITRNKAVPIDAKIDGEKLIVRCRASIRFKVSIAGIRRDLPNWNLPIVSDEQAQRCWDFWAGKLL